MSARVALAVLCALGGFVLGAPAAPPLAPAPRPMVAWSAEDPPPQVAALLKQVREGLPLARTTAAKALGQLPEAEPYLRLASMLADADPDNRSRLKAALTEHHIAIDARNVERAKKWAADGRIDMLVEAICFARWDTTADAMMELLYKFAEVCGGRATKLLKLTDDEPFRRPGPLYTLEEMLEAASAKKADGTAKVATVRRYSRGTDDPVRLDFTNAKSALIRAERVESRAGLSGSVAVVRDQWAPARGGPKFEHSLLFVNSNIELDDVDRCLIVIDGDVTRWGRGSEWASAGVRESVVIARGSICGSIRGPARVGRGTPSCVWAGGEIGVMRTPAALKDWAVLAGGKIAIEETKDKEKISDPAVVKEKTTDNPFGVRFFELKDVGLGAEDTPEGVRIKSIAPDSPLAGRGLRVGDVVFRVNEFPTNTVDQFRRELRRSLVWEAGVFWITRDGHRLTRVVHFPDGLK